MNFKKQSINFLIIIITTLICILIAELIIKFKFADNDRSGIVKEWNNLIMIPSLNADFHKIKQNNPNLSDEELINRIIGRGNFTKRIENVSINDNGSGIRNFSITYDHYGFKMFGNISTSKKKVLVLGDSFTEAYHVENGKEYYSILQNQFPEYEFFAYGYRGYAVLEEAILLKYFLDKINPDLIIWQITGNDIYSANPKLDKYYPYSYHYPGLYYKMNKIVYSKPRKIQNIKEYSYIAYYLGNVMNYRDIGMNPKLNDANKINTSLQTIKYILFDISREINHIPTIYVLAMEGYLLDTFTNEICSEERMNCITNISKVFDKYTSQTGIEPYIPNDGHWNKMGHQLVAEQIAIKLKKFST